MSSIMAPSSLGGTGRSTPGQPGGLQNPLAAAPNVAKPAPLSGAQAGVPSWMQPQGRPQPFQINMSAAHPVAQALAHPAVQQILNHPVVQQALSQPHVQQAIQQATQQPITTPGQNWQSNLQKQPDGSFIELNGVAPMGGPAAGMQQLNAGPAGISSAMARYGPAPTPVYQGPGELDPTSFKT